MALPMPREARDDDDAAFEPAAHRLPPNGTCSPPELVDADRRDDDDADHEVLQHRVDVQQDQPVVRMLSTSEPSRLPQIVPMPPRGWCRR